jgi:sensor histidine kinase YesM
MRSVTDQGIPECPEDVEQNQVSTSILFKLIWIPLGLTLLIVLLYLAMGRTRLSETGREFLYSFIYSALIALPSIVLLTRVSVRYTARYPRLVILLQALILTTTATVGCLVAGLIIQLIGNVPRGHYWREFWSSYPFSLIISLVAGLSVSAYETLRYRLQAAVLELRTRQVEQERAYKLLAEARLSSLESRIHPHFLFNTLNSIASLIPDDPQRAEEIVGRLASLLRFSLNANHSGLVPLSQELKIVHDYLEIEKTRFGARLRYEIDVPASMEFAQLPPLAIQSLVENCVKHVVNQRQYGGEIHVRGSLTSGRVILEVIDDGPGFALSAISPDHGLANLIARMQLLFGETGTLDVTQSDDRNVVRLCFPAAPMG